MTAPLDLDAIRARAEGATEGPWAWHSYMKTGRTLATPGPTFEMSLGGHTVHAATHELNVLKTTDDWPPNDADAEFIAHAREDVPALLAEVERLRADRDAQGRFLSTVDKFARASAMSHDAVLEAVGVKADLDRAEATIARVRRLPEFKAAVVEVRGGVFRDAIFVSDLRAAIEGTDS